MRRIIYCLAVLAGLVGAPPAVARPAAGLDLGAIEAQLQAVNGSLQDLVALLTVQVDTQRAELAVQRLDIARREVVTLGRELHDARTRRDSREQDQTRLLAQHESIEAGLDAEDVNADQRAQLQRQFDIEFEATESAMFRLDQRILDLESELVRAREDLMAWEELVADTLR